LIVQQVFVKGIAHSSYLLGGDKFCAVIDPSRDVDVYLDMAFDMGWKITHILETHLHADFISGHMDLMERTGANIFVPGSAGCEFDTVGVSEGDIFEIEDMSIRVMETPGHTPEHVSYVVTDCTRGADPVCVFCGDTLFVGDVGRPDLFPGKAEELASELYDSLHDKLLSLPDFCEVYPAHGAGSLCGRAMAAKRSSTIGYERLYNHALNIGEKAEFISSLTNEIPPAPDHFKRCSKVNATGPNLLSQLSSAEALPPLEFKKISEDAENIVLDIRCYEAFGGRHIPGAYSIDINSNFAIFSGWLLPENRTIMLVVDSLEQVSKASLWFHRVGLDRIGYFLEGGMAAWSLAGLSTQHVCQLSAEELHDLLSSGEELVLIDVRSEAEHREGHIQNSINIPVPELRKSYKDLDPDTKTVVICGSGQRSSMGASILQQNGFSDIYNVAGGMTGYNAAGYGPECIMCSLPWTVSGDRDKIK